MINYRYKINKNNYGNRGMCLEEDINSTNEYYIENDIALIYKKPTPIKATKVSYSNNKNIVINEGFFEKQSTTDYNGIYKGYYIDFEAKETNNKTSFSLNNIHKHQIKHLLNVVKHGGISFIIVRFNSISKNFLLESKFLENFEKENERKSIPLTYFEQYGYPINEKFIPRIDYIKIIDILIKEKTNEKNNI